MAAQSSQGSPEQVVIPANIGLFRASLGSRLVIPHRQRLALAVVPVMHPPILSGYGHQRMQLLFAGQLARFVGDLAFLTVRPDSGMAVTFHGFDGR